MKQPPWAGGRQSLSTAGKRSLAKLAAYNPPIPAADFLFTIHPFSTASNSRTSHPQHITTQQHYHPSPTCVTPSPSPPLWPPPSPFPRSTLSRRLATGRFRLLRLPLHLHRHQHHRQLQHLLRHQLPPSPSPRSATGRFRLLLPPHRRPPPRLALLLLSPRPALLLPSSLSLRSAMARSRLLLPPQVCLIHHLIRHAC